MEYKPMKKSLRIEVDVSNLFLAPNHYISIRSGPYAVEVTCKDDGTFQVCADDETLISGIHSYKDIYPDLLKEDTE